MFQLDSLLGLCPLELKLTLSDLEGSDKLHVVNLDLFRNQVRLFDTRLVVVVNVAVYRPKLPRSKPDLSPDFSRLEGPQVDGWGFFQDENFCG